MSLVNILMSMGECAKVKFITIRHLKNYRTLWQKQSPGLKNVPVLWNGIDHFEFSQTYEVGTVINPSLT